MIENKKPNFTSIGISYKEAVQEIQTILENVQGKGDENVVVLIDGILGDLMSGATTPKEALRISRMIRDNLNSD
ncbi:MAG: hypothetical protein WC884_02470 [Candidatus Paceibacterota bacterium]